MNTIDNQTPFTAVLASTEARAVIDEIAPEVLQSPMLENLSASPTGPFLLLILGEADGRRQAIMERLSTVSDDSPRPAHEPAIVPDPAYEPSDVPTGSARVTLPDRPEQNRMVELVLHGPSHGNPFVDVELSVTFTAGERTVSVGGFYDGEGRYAVRFLPPTAGEWRFACRSSARSLDGVEGAFEVAPSSAHGPVGVVDRFYFAHADGTPFNPVGTTAYAWIHQSEDLQDQTVATLAGAPFNKLRMCLFPKHFMHNTEEPERFVFLHADGTDWDTTRFDTEYFANLDRRIQQMEALGIEADIILFHPYDKWGFSHLSDAADERYLTYVVRRLAAYPNVWWSMANEYDLLPKRPADWDRLAAVVQREDHVGHPISIHNWVQMFDYSAPWATHASLQRGDYEIGKKVDEWRAAWGKPVLVDEFGYEGDLDQGWGNLLSEELVRRFWNGMLRGGFLTHGETYWDEHDLIWWSKGGALRGTSADRLRFLREIVAASPTGRVEPLTSQFDDVRGGVEGEYVLIYFNASRPRFRDVVVPEGMVARVDVIDTWAMTITPVPGTHTGTVRVDLPAKPYIAIRLTRASGESH